METMMNVTRRLMLCVCCFIAVNVFGVEEIATVPRQLKIFFTVSGDVTEDEKNIFLQTLLIKLSEDSDINLIEPVVERSLSPSEKTDRSRESGADCWLSADINASGEKVAVTYSSYDIRNGTFVFEDKKYEKIRTIPNLSRILWRNVLVDVAEQYSAITQPVEVKEIVKYNPGIKEVVEEQGVKVVFEAKPGTVIYGNGIEKVTVDETGLAKVECSQMETYKIRAEHSGYYPLEKNFYVETQPVKVVLDQKKASQFAFDLYFEQFDYFGGGFLYYIIPNYLYTELETTLFFKKIFWPVEKDGVNWEAPLMHVFLSLGYYLNKEDSLFRLAVETGVFFRLFFHEDLFISLDGLSGMGLKLCGVHLEVSSFPKLRFFYDHNIMLFFTDYPDLMRTAIVGSSNDDGMLFGYLFAEKFVMDFLNFRIGVRFIL
ncbi:MAG: hypothetical protein JW881_14440 [Spirochaetales bacterium]|nr:hypothetical protein [Spirochaetales bacterium]